MVVRASPAERHAALEEVDPTVAALLEREAVRQRATLNLIASENVAWPAVLAVLGSAPHNKYSEGYPGEGYHAGCEVVDELEQLAIDRAKALFAAEHANVEPHAGAQANMAVYLACLEPGDTMLSMRPEHGGHLSHGLRINFSGRVYKAVHYGVRREDGLIDLDEVRALARQHRPKLIVCGGSSYPRAVDTAQLREIADEVGGLLLCDMAHVGGLVAAGVYANPVVDCDFVTTTTNKTLGGPRGGLILCRAAHAAAVDRAVCPGMQGGALNDAIAAKAVAFAIAATDGFRRYAGRVCKNARVLAGTVTDRGFELLTGGTDSHMVVVDLRRTTWTGVEAEERLNSIGVVANRNAVPYDERSPMVTSGLRFGTAAATMRGLGGREFEKVGAIVADALGRDARLDALRARVDALVRDASLGK